MEAYTAYPKDKAQAKAIKAFFKALQVPYEKETQTAKSPYNPEFVAKILASDKSFADGKGVQIDLKKFFSI